MTKVWRVVRVLVCAAVVAGSGLRADGAEPGATFEDGQVKEIERIVRDYLIRNPSIMREVFTALEAEEEAKRQEKLLAVIENRSDELLRNERDAVLGNPAGDITLVEFFDYNCGFCKRALADLDALLKSDPKLRVVLKEFPILTPGSIEAAKVSMAAAKQSRFWEFHSALLNSRGEANEQKALRIAADVGLDMDQLRRDMADPGIADAIATNQDLATELSLDGTPAYIIGTTVVPGAVGAEELREVIQEARRTACRTC